MERDDDSLSSEPATGISTHTLTWSVTEKLVVESIDIIISTHTLTWSVTGSGIIIERFIFYFNSHAHVERDRRGCRRYP